MYIPNTINALGSQYMFLRLPEDLSYTFEIFITSTHMKATDQPSQRCTDVKDCDTSACIARYIEAELGCNPQIYGSNTSAQSRLCNSTTQLKDLAHISFNLMETDANGIYNVTGCLASCEKKKYQIMRTNPPRTSGAARQSKKLVIKVTIENGVLEEREQYLIYDTDSFLGDIGGFLGLTLGWSMYSLYIVTPSIVSRMKNKIMSNPMRPQSVK